MAYYEDIDLFVTSDRNHADVINEPLEKIIENIKDTRRLIKDATDYLDTLEKTFADYTKTEDLNELLSKGIKGDKGEDGIDGIDGKNLEFIWDEYELGVRQEGETDYQFTYLRGEKGEAGDVSLEQLEQAIQEAKTDLENEIANIPKVTKTSELTNDSGFITANDIPEVDLEPYALKTQIPTSLPASDVYDWAKEATKPTYTSAEVGALASNGTAVNASKVNNALTLQIAGTTKNTFNGSSAQTFNIPNASTSTSGVMTTTQVTTLNNHATEINNLKSTVVSGKTSVANAINGKLGTTLSNQTSFADMAYYIGTIPILSIENLYVGGSYLSTPSGVGIKYVIFNTISKSPASSHSDGYVTAEFTNNAQNAYRRVIIKGNHDGTRTVTTLNPKTINSTGTVTANLSFPEASSDVGTMITIAIFDNPIYDVKALTGDYLICIP